MSGEPQRAGDQSYSSRKAFFDNGMSACVKCGASTTSREECMDCRPNGDGYGTAIFTCSKPECGWSTSFLYDDAGDCYYYETRAWARGVAGLAVSEMGGWLREQGLDHLVQAWYNELIDGETLLRIRDELERYPKLKVGPEEAGKIRGALAQKGYR